MKKAQVVAAVAILLGSTASSPAATQEVKPPAGGPQEFILFRHEGRQPAEMTVQRDGAVSVTYSGRGHGENKEVFRINAEEIAALDALVAFVDFFSLPEVEVRVVEHDGRSRLRVTSQGKTRELTYGHLPQLDPLGRALWKIVNQGVILHELKARQSVYDALGAISPHLVSAKVLDPKVLEGPLKAFVAESRGDRLDFALEAIAWLLTEEQWLGYLWDEFAVADAERSLRLLEVITNHPFYANIPKAHLGPVCIVATLRCRALVRNLAGLSRQESLALNRAVALLGEERRQDVIPMLVSLLESRETRGVAANALFRMGQAAIGPVEKAIEHPNGEIRETATRIVRNMLEQRAIRTGPKAIPKEAQEALLKQLRATTVPLLERLAAGDPSPVVRQAAQRALDRIEQGWPKLDD